ncbi:MAG: hypothetical protein RIB71_12700 [Imperialibacter sp.]|uniref:hypothetical protein n=1 Tax=Imperialibacter sp. TaxID=2038411 RepID=UPI0032EEE570
MNSDWNKKSLTLEVFEKLQAAKGSMKEKEIFDVFPRLETQVKSALSELEKSQKIERVEKQVTIKKHGDGPFKVRDFDDYFK